MVLRTLSLLELLPAIWRKVEFENSVRELKMKYLCTFPGHVLEHNGDILFQLHSFWCLFLVYIRVEQHVILVLNMIIEETVILPFYVLWNLPLSNLYTK